MINYVGIHCHDEIKKSFKTSNGSSEAVSRRTEWLQETGENDTKLHTEN